MGSEMCIRDSNKPCIVIILTVFDRYRWQISSRIRLDHSLYVYPALSPSMSHRSNRHSSLYLLTARRCGLRHLLEGPNTAQAFSIRPAAGGCSPPNAGSEPTRIQDPSGISRQFVCALPARPPHPPNSRQPGQLPGQFASEFPRQFAPQQHQPQSLITVLCCIFAVNTHIQWR